MQGYRVIGDLDSLPGLLAAGSVDEVVLAEPLDPQRQERMLAVCREHGVRATAWRVGTVPLTGGNVSTG